jgi:hypothetical protein
MAIFSMMKHALFGMGDFHWLIAIGGIQRLSLGNEMGLPSASSKQ